MNTSVMGFNGERLEPISDTTHLGNGYRAYNPILMRLTCPDSMSPFGGGGVNVYAYCAGDPVNHADPTGHLSWQAWLGIGMGIVGLGLAVFSAGASISAAGGIVAAIESASAVSLAIGAAGLVSDLTAIASGATVESNLQASAILSWVSLGTGVVGLAHGAYSAGVAGYRWGRRMMSVTSPLPVSSVPKFTTIYEAMAPERFSESVTIDASNTSVLGVTTGPGGSGVMEHNISFAFEEVANNRNLNITAHMGSRGLGLSSGSLNAQETYNLLSQNVSRFPSGYDSYRFFGCDSDQLAREFSSVAKNKLVLGFEGMLTHTRWNRLTDILGEHGNAFYQIFNGQSLRQATIDLQHDLQQLPQRELTIRYDGLSRTYRNGSLIEAEPIF